MFTAILIMLGGIAAGRMLRAKLNPRLLSLGTTAAIFLLLFFLGVSIGSNTELLEDLPALGWQALIIMLGCVAGSIFCSLMIQKLFFAPDSDRANRNVR